MALVNLLPRLGLAWLLEARRSKARVSAKCALHSAALGFARQRPLWRATICNGWRCKATEREREIMSGQCGCVTHRSVCDACKSCTATDHKLGAPIFSLDVSAGARTRRTRAGVRASLAGARRRPSNLIGAHALAHRRRKRRQASRAKICGATS